MGAKIQGTLVSKEVVIVDYGAGNLWSIANAVEYLGFRPRLAKASEDILKASMLILPGVGAFNSAMKNLQSAGLVEAIQEAALIKKRKVLGICLGMQLLGLSSKEGGITRGLGIINSEVKRLHEISPKGVKLPHIGFNLVIDGHRGELFKSLPINPYFYFVHSYCIPLTKEINGIHGKCTYGGDFLASYERENIFATQFHPEKSQMNGLILLRNFLAL